MYAQRSKNPHTQKRKRDLGAGNIRTAKNELPIGGFGGEDALEVNFVTRLDALERVAIIVPALSKKLLGLPHLSDSMPHRCAGARRHVGPAQIDGCRRVSITLCCATKHS
jgi:hypothetical protein